MSLLNKLLAGDATNQSFNGTTPPASPFSFTSDRHNTYSINGLPKLPNQPPPSNLDLGGVTPSQYINNLPG
jgi:hypothetical protein